MTTTGAERRPLAFSVVSLPRDTSEDMTALEALRDVFGYAELRRGQAAAVDAMVAGRDALVLLPTGAGKSLCYQLPAIVRARRGEGTTIVISPLIALMNDQVSALAARGVAAAALHSQCDEPARLDTIRRLTRGELALLYVSPERAVLDGFKRLLARTRIAILAIDEAHCVSHWGHDFRPEYMRLAELRDVVAAPMIALTATATPRVLAEVASALALRDPVVVRGDFRRPNLAFEVLRLAATESRLAATIDALERAGLRPRTGPGRAIVYCSTRKKAEEVAAALANAGFAAAHYHAGRTAPRAHARASRVLARPDARAGGDQRVRDGRRLPGRPRDRALPGAREPRGVLPGGRTRGPRRRACALPVAVRRGRSDDAATDRAGRHDRQGPRRARRIAAGDQRVRGGVDVPPAPAVRAFHRRRGR